MKRFTSIFNKRASQDSTGFRTSDSPEANAGRAVVSYIVDDSSDWETEKRLLQRLFCESGAPNNAGEELLHLPVLVDAAESSPAAATAAAYQIRKFLSKENVSRPHVQYNAIMLVRILSDNPGSGFTNNIDEKFRLTVKSLLRLSRDPSVQQILRETLNSMEVEKAQDENLKPLLSMWRNEKGMVRQGQVGNGNRQYPITQAHTVIPHTSSPRRSQANHLVSSRARNGGQLPGPEELASRIEEARNSAKLLMQLTQSTPSSEFLSHDLIMEFAERCQSAQGNLQGYMNSTHPPPDEQTFQTLIETCEQLSVALSKHQRAMLAARRESTMAPASLYGRSMGTASTPSPSFNMQAQLQQRSAITPTTSKFLLDPPIGDSFSDDRDLESDRQPIAPALSPPRIIDHSYNYGRAPSPMPGAVELPVDQHTPPLPELATPGSAAGQIPVHGTDSMKISTVFEPIWAAPAGRSPIISHSARNTDVTFYKGNQATARQFQTQNFANYAGNRGHNRQLPPDTPDSFWTKQLHQQKQLPLQSTSLSNDIPFPQGIQELHATPSYITRQDIAVDKHIMSGGASSPPSARSPVTKFNPPPLAFPPSRIPPIPTTPPASGAHTPPTPVIRPYWEQQQSPKTNRRPRRTSADYEGKGWGDEDEDRTPETHRAARIKDDDPVTPMTPVGGTWRRYGPG